MKKSNLLILSLLSLLALSACSLLPNAKPADSSPASSSKAKSSSSSSSRRARSSSDEENDDYDDDDYSYSSSSSQSRKDPNYTPTLEDQGEALEALTDVTDIPKWAEFKSIKVESLIGSAGPAASKRDEVISKMGETSSTISEGAIYSGSDYSILFSFNEQGTVTAKSVEFDNAQKVDNLKDIQPGMTAQEVVAKHGRPQTIYVFGYMTIFEWEGKDGKEYSVSFDKDKVYEIEEP